MKTCPDCKQISASHVRLCDRHAAVDELVEALGYQIEHGSLGNGDIQRYTDAHDLLAKLNEKGKP